MVTLKKPRCGQFKRMASALASNSHWEGDSSEHPHAGAVRKLLDAVAELAAVGGGPAAVGSAATEPQVSAAFSSKQCGAIRVWQRDFNASFRPEHRASREFSEPPRTYSDL